MLESGAPDSLMMPIDEVVTWARMSMVKVVRMTATYVKPMWRRTAVSTAREGFFVTGQVYGPCLIRLDRFRRSTHHDVGREGASVPDPA